MGDLCCHFKSQRCVKVSHQRIRHLKETQSLSELSVRSLSNKRLGEDMLGSQNPEQHPCSTDDSITSRTCVKPLLSLLPKLMFTAFKTLIGFCRYKMVHVISASFLSTFALLQFSLLFPFYYKYSICLPRYFSSRPSSLLSSHCPAACDRTPALLPIFMLKGVW